MRMTTIWLAGEDRTAERLPRLDRTVAGRDPAVAAQAAAHAAPLSLRDASDEAGELDRRLALLQAYGVVRTEPFDVPSGTGVAAGLMKRLKQGLWRLLRYQHERMAVQQNAVNRQLLMALESVLEEQRRARTALEKRIAALEAARPGGAEQQP